MRRKKSKFMTVRFRRNWKKIIRCLEMIRNKAEEIMDSC